jgi:signal transduction histidine kinase/DNA-binding NarL/FixJ family response regulator
LPPTPNIKILVVDDLAENLVVYQSVLEAPGVELVSARSGTEALRRVLQDDFAVILLDVNMPDMDGYETASMIRTRKRSAHTPIIFVTAYADELHALKGYSYGAVDYILSPVLPDVLRTKVRVFVDLCRLNQQAREQAAAQVAVAERERAHLTALLEKATDFVGRVDVDGRLLHINHAGCRMLGYDEAADERDATPRMLSAGTLEAERRGASPRPWVFDPAALAIARAEGVWFGEATLRARDGRDIPVAQVILAHRNAEGVTESFSVIARDISERKRTESELAEHRARLEDLVRERTAELQASHERLRLADRLASIGTLAAGLGHDMGNLLMPIRARLGSLERMDLPPEAQDDVRAIKTAGEYLKRLSHGLRLFALDPAEARTGENTALIAWWPDVEPFLRNTLPKGVTLRAELPPNLPPIAIPPHAFTQVIYNLVQNAGDAMRERGQGRVSITASIAKDKAGAVRVSVADDGPGMTEEVRQRCMEPFFTTRTRRISTGLGLALVRGAIGNAHGSIDIESRPGRGTTFHLLLPAATAAPRPASRRGAGEPMGAACVALKDDRLNAYVTSLLRSMHMEVVIPPREAPAGEVWTSDVGAAQLLVLDSVNGRWPGLQAFLSGDERRRALVFGGLPPAVEHIQVTWLAERPSPASIREALQQVIGAWDSSSRSSAIEGSHAQEEIVI